MKFDHSWRGRDVAKKAGKSSNKKCRNMRELVNCFFEVFRAWGKPWRATAEWMFLLQKQIMKVEVPTMKVETLMSLTRYAAYSGRTFMNPFKVSRKVILHFAQRQHDCVITVCLVLWKLKRMYNNICLLRFFLEYLKWFINLLFIQVRFFASVFQ